jgi:predicted nucleic acid-binding protein
MVIADTGFWLALANQCDKHHETATRCLEDLREPLITTWPVMTETCHLLLHRLGEKAQRAFIHSYVNGAFQVFDLSHADAGPIESYMKKYAKLPMDLADASLVVLADHLGQGRILSTDTRDFRTYRWKQRRPFENLLFSVQS